MSLGGRRVGRIIIKKEARESIRSFCEEAFDNTQ
jgi:hypothetical protein